MISPFAGGNSGLPQPADRDASRRNLPTRAVGGLGNGEWAIVILMVVSSIFIALSLWQATRFAAHSEELVNQARFAEAQESRWRSSVETLIAHDRQVLLGCETATERRNIALREHAQAFDDTAIPDMVGAEYTRLALEALLVVNPTEGCSDYDVSRKLEWADFDRNAGLRPPDPVTLRDEAGQWNEAERWMVVAAVAFAGALVVLTLADWLQGHSSIRRWLGIGGVVFLVTGLTVAVRAVWKAGHVPGIAIALTGALLVVLAVIAWLLARTTSRPSRAQLPGRLGILSVGFRRRWAAGGVHLPRGAWAKILGAVSLLVFTLAAVGLSVASIDEREALAKADQLESQAREALDLGQRSALAVLGFVAEYAELDAYSAARAQENAQLTEAIGSPRRQSSDVVQARATTLDHLWDKEYETWEGLLRAHDVGSGCVREELVLAWVPPGDKGRDPEGADASFPATVLDQLREDPAAVSRLVENSSVGASACSAQSALILRHAHDSGSRASIFTVALVVLGLAGFLFAMAADPNRTRVTGRWLLVSGIAGLLAGSMITMLAFLYENAPLSDETLKSGAVAYAQGEAARMVGDCANAQELSAQAIRHLDDWAPAYVSSASAAACDDGWLFDPLLKDVGLFKDPLEQAYRLGMRDSTVVGNLGWAYMLEGLDTDDNEPARRRAINRGAELTREALLADPSNPFLCFNWAFASLVRGDLGAAPQRYEQALTSLRGDVAVQADRSDVGCNPVEFEDPILTNLLRLLALSDLELLPEADTSKFRSWIVAGSVTDGEKASESADFPQLGLDLEFYPREVSVRALDGSPWAGRNVSAIGYYRAQPKRPWAVVPLMSRLDGSLLDSEWRSDGPYTEISLFDLGRTLPPGEYRIDFFVDGILAGGVHEENGWWDSYLEFEEFRSVDVPEMGILTVIPADWTLLWEQRGMEVVYGSETGKYPGKVAFRRIEGAPQDGLEKLVDAWALPWLEEWAVQHSDIDSDMLRQDWYLNLPYAVTIEVPHIALGIGHTQYLIADESDPLLDQEDLDDPSCPGSTYMTLIHANDEDLTEAVWLSQGRTATMARHEVNVKDIDLRGSFYSPRFGLSFPADWAGAGCPEKFIAISPDQKANILVSSYPQSRESLEKLVDDTLAEYAESKDFANFSLQNRRGLSLANGVSAEEIAFSWTTTRGFDVKQTQVLAIQAGREYILTFTTTPDVATDYQDDLAQIIGSFEPGLQSESLIPAACLNCTEVERRERRDHLDELGGSLAVINPSYCRDTSDNADDDVMARIGCSFAGGFHADFELWKSSEVLDLFTLRFEDRPGMIKRDWHLDGIESQRTGTTLEWIEAGDARMLWTYDDRRISVYAQLDGGDQARLNNWWNATAALTRS